VLPLWGMGGKIQDLIIHLIYAVKYLQFSNLFDILYLCIKYKGENMQKKNCILSIVASAIMALSAQAQAAETEQVTIAYQFGWPYTPFHVAVQCDSNNLVEASSRLKDDLQVALLALQRDKYAIRNTGPNIKELCLDSDDCFKDEPAELVKIALNVQ